MVDPLMTDDELRSLVRQASEILEDRQKRDLASLIRGLPDGELRELIRCACEELQHRRRPESPNADEHEYRFVMKLSKKGRRPEIIRHTVVAGEVVGMPLELEPVGPKQASIGGTHVLRNGDFLEVRYAAGNVVYGLPFNGWYIAEDVPAMAVPGVSDDPNILPRLRRYALGARSELAPEAKKARASTLEMARYYGSKIKELERKPTGNRADDSLDRQFYASYTQSLAREREYVQLLDTFLSWIGGEAPVE
jgi:hypothetical protein